MYRNFYNLLELRCFLRTLSWYAAWNGGIVECWKTGSEKRKKVYSTKNVVSTFYDDARQTSIFCFYPRKYANITRKSIQLYSFWFSIPTIPIFSPSRRVCEPEARTHYSLRGVGSTSRRPIFQHSNIPIVSEANCSGLLFQRTLIFCLGASRRRSRDSARFTGFSK